MYYVTFYPGNTWQKLQNATKWESTNQKITLLLFAIVSLINYSCYNKINVVGNYENVCSLSFNECLFISTFFHSRYQAKKISTSLHKKTLSKDDRRRYWTTNGTVQHTLVYHIANDHYKIFTYIIFRLKCMQMNVTCTEALLVYSCIEQYINLRNRKMTRSLWNT